MSENDFRTHFSNVWTGRIDGSEPDVLRWHQIVEAVDLDHLKMGKSGRKGICFLGYACDLGAIKNKGRSGSRSGPGELRKMCASFPVHSRYTLYDAGDIQPVDGSIHVTQELLGRKVCQILDNGLFPMVLGGDHSLAFGHYLGIREHIKRKRESGIIGIINVDAHFDLREVDSHKEGHSGSSFYQISEECKIQEIDFHYLPVGVRKNSNSSRLYNIAASLRVNYISSDEFGKNKDSVSRKVREFIDRVDHVYLSICLDAFDVTFAPGVSAPGINGMAPASAFYRFLSTIVESRKLISVDIAELNPEFDESGKTARLGAGIIFELVDHLVDLN